MNATGDAAREELDDLRLACDVEPVDHEVWQLARDAYDRDYDEILAASGWEYPQRLGGHAAEPRRAGRPRPQIRAAESLTMKLAVTHEERYWYPDDGGIVWVAGFMPIDPTSRRFLGRDALRERGLLVAGVAGAAAHHGEALQSDGAQPGAPLELRRDAGNEHDPNAIAVHLATGELLGFVPRELAAELAPRLDGGEEWSAIVLREQRASPRDPRTGATMLLAPADEIELDVR